MAAIYDIKKNFEDKACYDSIDSKLKIIKKICPFMNIYNPNTGNVFMYCIESFCACWLPQSEKCGLVLADMIKKSNNTYELELL